MTKVSILTSVHKHTDVRVYVKEARSLAMNGFEVDFICPDYEGIDDLGIKFYKIKHRTSRVKRILFSPFSVLSLALKQNSDIYHFHDPELIFVGFILKIIGKKVIYDVHEDVPRQILSKPYLKPFVRKISSRLFEFYENLFTRAFDGIIAATKTIEDRFGKTKRRKTVTIYNYPKLIEFETIQYDFDKAGDKICYVGGITKVRGIVEIVKALEYTKANLVLMGDFDSQTLKDEVSSLTCYNKVEYKGFANRETVVAEFKKVKAGLVTLHPIPNYLVSLPVKMFEYMLAGLPVIASNFEFFKSIVVNGDCGICVDPLNPKEIGDAINFILKNPKDAKRMGENGKRLVLEKYNWSIEEKRLIDFYKEIQEKK